MSVLPKRVKDAGAQIDYTFNWADDLGVDTIATSTWEAEDGIDIEADSKTNTTTTVMLSGGAGDKAVMTYKVKNTITTAGGRTFVRRLKIVVAET